MNDLDEMKCHIYTLEYELIKRDEEIIKLFNHNQVLFTAIAEMNNDCPICHVSEPHGHD